MHCEGRDQYVPEPGVDAEAFMNGLRFDREGAVFVCAAELEDTGPPAAGKTAGGETGLTALSPSSFRRLPKRFFSEPIKDLRTPSRWLLLLLLLLSDMVQPGWAEREKERRL